MATIIPIRIEEIIGNKIILPSRFKSQKEYVTKVLKKETGKRLGCDMDYSSVEKLPDDWASYKVQDAVNAEGAPSERVVKLMGTSEGCDIVLADDALKRQEVTLLEKAYQTKSMAPDTVTPEELANLRKFDLFEELD